MNQRTIAIAAVLMAAALTGIFTTSPLAYADESETSTDERFKQKSDGSDGSTNVNCGAILTKSDATICGGSQLPPSP
jgi:hypothetical protein